MSVEKIENGGPNAIKGFNFQAFVGINYMLDCYVDDLKFKMFFETKDDLEIYLDGSDKYKIQVKTTKITNGNLHKKNKTKTGNEVSSIYEKLMSANGYDYYKLVVPFGKYCNTLKDKRKEVDDENILGVNNYLIEGLDEKFLLTEMEFIDDYDNARHLILGKMIDSKKNLDISNYVDTLFSYVYRLSEIKYTGINQNAKSLSTAYLDEVFKSMNSEKEIDSLLDSLDISSRLKADIRLELERIKINPDILTYTELKKLDLSPDQSPFESDEMYIKENTKLIHETNNGIEVKKIFVYFIKKVMDEEE